MKLIKNVLAGAVTLALAGAAQAIPTLQLDILGGYYVNGCPAGDTLCNKETIYAPQDSDPSKFTLYAYLIPDKDNLVTDKYYLSMALVPMTPQTQPAPALGSFDFDGSPIAVAGGMTYGTPPIQTLAAYIDPNNGDLQTHSIFPTYFYEDQFAFAGSQTAPYNTAEDTGKDPTTGGTGMYYMAFSIDVANLADDTAIHFDLYNSKLCGDTSDSGKCTPPSLPTDYISVTSFAPFSHDAQSLSSGNGGPPATGPVPEPGTITLLGVGMLGALFYRRRAQRAEA